MTDDEGVVLTTERPLFLNGVRGTPGVNLDRISVEAGMRELSACGWPVTEGGENIKTRTVIQHALVRWARGEEEAAARGAIDPTFHGINLLSWLRVLAAARAGGEASAIPSTVL